MKKIKTAILNEQRRGKSTAHQILINFLLVIWIGLPTATVMAGNKPPANAYQLPTMTEKDSLPLMDIDEKRIPEPTPKHEPLSGLGNPVFYEVFGQRYYVDKSTAGYKEKGYASWYGTKFHGKRTSSGEPYDMYAMTAASKTLPIPCYVKVTNLENGRKTVVRVNDRGPFHHNRIIDLSYTAAKKLGIIGKGTAYVTVEALPPHQKLPDVPITLDTPTLAKNKGTLYLQIGAFGEKINAEKFAQDIRKIVKLPVQVTLSAFSYGAFYRVKVGPFNSSAEGKKINHNLQIAGLARGVMTVG